MSRYNIRLLPNTVKERDMVNYLYLAFPRMTYGRISPPPIKFSIMAAKKEEKKILLVDHDKHSRAALHSVLTRNGYQCYTLGSAFQAIKEVENKPFSLVLVINNFEDMPGIELASMIKSNFPSVKVIQMVEHPEEDEEKMSLQAGVDHYIPDCDNKNFLLEIIQKTI